jgi:hypothetical protein
MYIDEVRYHGREDADMVGLRLCVR